MLQTLLIVDDEPNIVEGLASQFESRYHGDGKWHMEGINKTSFKDNVNASFLHFIQRFFAVSGQGMIKDPLPYSGPDPNGEETSHVETTIPAEEWSTFLPTVPDDLIYNILYGQKYGKGDRKILVFRGLSNGIETRLIFKQHHGKWRLEKIKAY